MDLEEDREIEVVSMHIARQVCNPLPAHHAALDPGVNLFAAGHSGKEWCGENLL